MPWSFFFSWGELLPCVTLIQESVWLSPNHPPGCFCA